MGFENSVLRVEKIVAGGFGLCKTAGEGEPLEKKVFLVRYVHPGESVRVKTANRKKGVFFAEEYELVEKSPERIDPPCPYFSTCGGCSFQMAPHSLQIEWKKDILVENFERISDIKIDRNQIRVIALGDYEYRYRIRLQVNEGKIGFYKAGSREIVEIKDCMLPVPALRNALRAFLRAGRSNPLPNEIQAIELRSNLNQNQMMIVFIGKRFTDIYSLSLYAKDVSEWYEEVSIVYSPSKNNLPGFKFELIEGSDRLYSSFNEKSFGFSAISFYQPNLRLAMDVYELIAEKTNKTIEKEGLKKVIDLYCGAGVLDLFLSDEAEILGIEENPVAIDDARINSFLNGKHIEYLNFDASEIESFREAEILIMNPPATGVTPNIIQAAVKQSSIRNLIYLSCDPATLARDVGRIKTLDKSSSFQIDEIYMIDFYPQTEKIETLVFMSR